jgi:hypothetical protein
LVRTRTCVQVQLENVNTVGRRRSSASPPGPSRGLGRRCRPPPPSCDLRRSGFHTTQNTRSSWPRKAAAPGASFLDLMRTRALLPPCSVPSRVSKPARVCDLYSKRGNTQSNTHYVNNSQFALPNHQISNTLHKPAPVYERQVVICRVVSRRLRHPWPCRGLTDPLSVIGT